MFFIVPPSAIHSLRRAAYANFTKQARFRSVNAVSLTKRLYCSSVLMNEKQAKTVKTKKSNGNKLETSKLYPDEWEKLIKYDAMEDFSITDDNSKVSPSGEISGSKKSKVAANEFQAFKEEKSLYGRDDVKNEAVDLAEKISDSDSDSDTDTDTDLKFFDNLKHKRQLSFSDKDVGDYKINYLPRRSEFLRSELEEAMVKKNELVLLRDIKGIIYLAKKKILPITIFFTNAKVLQYIPMSHFDDVNLYKITSTDLRYWSPTAVKGGSLAIYRKEELKNTKLEAHLPVTVICDGLKHKLSLGHIMHSASMCPPKNFLISEGVVHPWSSTVMFSSAFSALNLNYDFNLNWREIREKINDKDHVYVVPVETYSSTDKEGQTRIRHNATDLLSIPSVDLYNYNFRDREGITLIMKETVSGNVSKDFLDFCLERNAVKIDVGLRKVALPSVLFSMIYFEIRRQCLPMNGKNKSGRSHNENDRKTNFRVRITSTLF